MKHPDAHTKLYCLFGKPATHSLSPAMHNAAFEESGINALYLAFEPTGIQDAVHSMRTLPIYGASVTIPYKTEVMEYIDTIDPLARKIGAVNTLVNHDGSITGYNTDGQGALRALDEHAVETRGRHVLILGNGGAARAIAFTLLREGSRITIAGRNIENIRRLARDLRVHHPDVEYIGLAGVTADFTHSVDVIINTTPVGMTPDISSSPLDESVIHSENAIMDIVYRPQTTQLLHISKGKGCAVVPGVEMLFYQGIRQFELWTGMPAPVKVMRNALEGGIAAEETIKNLEI